MLFYFVINCYFVIKIISYFFEIRSFFSFFKNCFSSELSFALFSSFAMKCKEESRSERQTEEDLEDVDCIDSAEKQHKVKRQKEILNCEKEISERKEV